MGMRVLKTKAFARFARRERFSDQTLRDVVDRANRGLVDADLEGGLIKQRVPRRGQRRSGGYRTLTAYQARRRTVALYGFPKSERDDIRPDELVIWRGSAAEMLKTGDTELRSLIATRELIKVGPDG
jgi:hypothetical protein